MREMTIKIHEVATDGLPDMENLTGRVAFVFDGCVVSGWPLHPAQCSEVYERAKQPGSHRGGAGRSEADKLESIETFGLWEADSDVGHGTPFCDVTHWIEFPVPVWELGK